jgi:hypothetical protein
MRENAALHLNNRRIFASEFFNQELSGNFGLNNIAAGKNVQSRITVFRPRMNRKRSAITTMPLCTD